MGDKNPNKPKKKKQAIEKPSATAVSTISATSGKAASNKKK
jgi:hypothetical protein